MNDELDLNPIGYSGAGSSLTLSSSNQSVPAYTYQQPQAPNGASATSYLLRNDEGIQYFTWPTEMSTDWGDGVNSSVQVGNATVSYQLTATFRPSHRSHASCVVPKVKGLTQGQAAKAIKKAGCRVGRVTDKHSKHVAKHKVISSSPQARKKEPAGTKIALVVSSGK